LLIDGIYGKKKKTTRVFTKTGDMVEVTAIAVPPCKITQIKGKEHDGYNAIQVAVGEDKKKPNHPIEGHFKKSGVAPTKILKEIRVEDLKEFKLGQDIKVDIFKEGDMVDVVGVSKGKGFAGVVKRHHFAGGPATHGSRFHRSVGSIGSRKPRRTFKGKRMPGRLGGERVTIQNLEIEKIIPDQNLLLVKGSVPGAKGGLLFIKKAVKG